MLVISPFYVACWYDDAVLTCSTYYLVMSSRTQMDSREQPFQVVTQKRPSGQGIYTYQYGFAICVVITLHILQLARCPTNPLPPAHSPNSTLMTQTPRAVTCPMEIIARGCLEGNIRTLSILPETVGSSQALGLEIPCK